MALGALPGQCQPLSPGEDTGSPAFTAPCRGLPSPHGDRQPDPVNGWEDVLPFVLGRDPSFAGGFSLTREQEHPRPSGTFSPYGSPPPGCSVGAGGLQEPPSSPKAPNPAPRSSGAPSRPSAGAEWGGRRRGKAPLPAAPFRSVPGRAPQTKPGRQPRRRGTRQPGPTR